MSLMAGSPIIRDGYAAWIKDPKRRGSPETDFGVRWTQNGSNWPLWRISWIGWTGELYAVELGSFPARFCVLGVYAQEDLSVMDGWAEPSFEIGPFRKLGDVGRRR